MSDLVDSNKPLKLSDHFSSTEFACSHCGVLHIDMRLIRSLEQLRSAVGPLTVNSGYRCPEHNAEVGGKTKSEHQFGRAADVALPKGLTMPKFYEACEAVPLFASGGIGLYPKERFIHVDVRSTKARWARVNGAYVAIDEAFKPAKGAKA